MMKGRAGQILGGGIFSKKRNSIKCSYDKTSKTYKWSKLKSLIESDKILINDFNMIEELSTFVRRKYILMKLKRILMMILLCV